jgi:tRNA A-37 threonylcarbamoyl transferase component Bud32
MGALYLASETIADATRPVVIKEMLDYYDPNDLQGPAKAQKRFKAEAATLVKLSVPGVPQVYDYFVEGGRYFFVMQFVEGRNLETGLTHLDDNLNLVQGRPYPIEQVRSWGIQLAKVLDILTTHQVVHLDIKPANLIVDQAGVVWLVDFGTSKAPHTFSPGAPGGKSAGSAKTSVYGTPGYAPPEQASGQPEARSDVFALAATLYHLATDDDPARNPWLFPDLKRLPVDIQNALRRALVKDVKQRISARELGRLLEPRGTRPLGFYWKDGSMSLDPLDLVTAASRNWQEARGYFVGEAWEKWLRDSHRHDLAAALVKIRSQEADPDMALDAFIRNVDAMFPAARLSVLTTTMDAGSLQWHQEGSVNLEIRNTGQGCLRARITSTQPGIKPVKDVVSVHDRQEVSFKVGGGTLSPANQVQQFPVMIDAGNAGQARVVIQVTVPEPGIQVTPAVLNLGAIYQGQAVSGNFIVSNSGGSVFHGEVKLNASGWSLQPTQFTCAPGNQRSLTLVGDTRRMHFGKQLVRITVQARAGGWEKQQSIQALLDVSRWRTFIRYWAPPLAWFAGWALTGALVGWLLLGLLVNGFARTPDIPTGLLIGGLLGVFLCVPPSSAFGALGWLGGGKGRQGLRKGLLFGAIVGLAIGLGMGALAGWIGLHLAVLGCMIGASIALAWAALLWRLVRR